MLRVTGLTLLVFLVPVRSSAQDGLPSGAALTAARCQRAINKTGVTLAARKLKGLAKCHGAALKCVETQPSDVGCRSKARTKCIAALVKIAAVERRLEAIVADRCASEVPELGFDEAGARCAAAEGGSTTSVVGRCIRRQRGCEIERLFEVQAPRAGELFRVLEVPTFTVGGLGCLTDHGGGGDGVLAGDVTTRQVVRCGRVIAGSGESFSTRRLRALTQCADRVFACVASEAGADECLLGADAFCDAAFRKAVADAEKVAQAIAQRCGAATIRFDVLRAPTGLNLDALETRCAGVGVATLESLADYTDCLISEHTCRVERIVRAQTPRVDELLAIVGQELGSPFCAPVPEGTTTATPRALPTPTMVATAIDTPTIVPTPTVAGPTPSAGDATPTASITSTPSAATTPTASGSSTVTLTRTQTPIRTGTPTRTRTVTPSRTRTPTPTPRQTPVCGNDLVEGDEECDGTDLDDNTCFDLCADQFEEGGTLRCRSNCTYNFAGCLGNECEP